MSEIDDKINELESRLDELLKTQITFQEKTNQIRYEIGVLRAIQQKRRDQPQASSPVSEPQQRPTTFTSSTQPSQPRVPYTPPDQREPTKPPVRSSTYQSTSQPPRPRTEQPRDVPPPRFTTPPPSVTDDSPRAESAFSRYLNEYVESARQNLEEFIGENLISKIGILILLVGIGIGVKYSIDNNLISPLTRIILGYAFGFGLTGLAIWIRRKYHNFSAVLLSGGMSAMYFVTYFAYSLYGLLGQSSAFGLMVMFTIATVTAALIYNRQVIAHIGLVGAYAIPFLLSDNSGNYAFLFSYMAILNAGVLIISIKRAWNPIFYTASGFTWAIFLGWYASKYSAPEHFHLALIFLGVFFLTFYAAKIIQRRSAAASTYEEDMFSVLVTVGIFFAFSFAIGTTAAGTARSIFLLIYVAASSLLVLGSSMIDALTVPGTRTPLFYLTSLGTWATFLMWFVGKYSVDEHFYLAHSFLALFFVIFYGSKILYERLGFESAYQERLAATLGTAAISFAFCLAIGTTATSTPQYVFLLTYTAAATVLILGSSIAKALAVPGTRIPVFYVASVGGWASLLGWFVNKYSPAEHFYLALIFLGIFFAIFYAARIIHTVCSSDGVKQEDLIAMILTTLVFYAFCFGISNLNSGNGDVTTLFMYIAAFSVAILVTSYRFYGRFLVIASYPFTWLIYGSWFTQHFDAASNFAVAAIFAALFFSVYYVTTLIYRSLSDKITVAEYGGLLLTNSFVFYGFGFAMMDSRDDLRNYEGMFTAVHGVFHLSVAGLMSLIKSKASDIINVLTILVITFLTVAVPIQFDGNRITMIWAVEGALLFWMARLKRVAIFEYFSYPVLLLAIGSLFYDWVTAFIDRTSAPSEYNLPVFANGNFVTALVFIGAFAFVFIVNRKKDLEPMISGKLVKPFAWSIAAVGLFVLYNTFRIEISNYFHPQYVAARAIETDGHLIDDVRDLNAVWQIIYTMAFFSALNLVTLRWIRSRALGYVSFAISVLSLFVLVLFGSGMLMDLRQSYMISEPSSPMLIAIRYVAYGAVAFLFYSLYACSKDEMFHDDRGWQVSEFIFDGLAYISVLVLASLELINLMAQYRVPDSTKFGLSVLWGVYSLVLVAIGIKWGKKHLRIGAMVLLAVTLVKLFFYDVADLPTIPKTILFVSLGVLMLIVSFLYTKYKDFIFGEPIEDEKL